MRLASRSPWSGPPPAAPGPPRCSCRSPSSPACCPSPGSPRCSPRRTPPGSSSAPSRTWPAAPSGTWPALRGGTASRRSWAPTSCRPAGPSRARPRRSPTGSWPRPAWSSGCTSPPPRPARSPSPPSAWSSRAPPASTTGTSPPPLGAGAAFVQLLHLVCCCPARVTASSAELNFWVLTAPRGAAGCRPLARLARPGLLARCCRRPAAPIDVLASEGFIYWDFTAPKGAAGCWLPARLARLGLLAGCCCRHVASIDVPANEDFHLLVVSHIYLLAA